MIETADVVVVGAGVQGASLAFHLARRGASVVVVERETVGGRRDRAVVRLRPDALRPRERRRGSPGCRSRTSESWAEQVGAGDCGFVRTGFLHADAAEALAAEIRANVAMQQALGVDTLRPRGRRDRRASCPGARHRRHRRRRRTSRGSGYADPSGTAAGFLEAARGARGPVRPGLPGRSRSRSRASAVVGVETDRGRIAAPVVVDAAGAWAADLARTVGVEVPVEPWRHDTAYFGLPAGHGPDFPIVIDEINEVYFRPEGRDLMLVGLEGGNEVGGSPDRPLDGAGARPPSRTWSGGSAPASRG